MRHSNITRHVIVCIGLLTVGAALAKDPGQTLAASVSAVTPAGCVDSPRGRTHILRFCGDEHYWIKRPVGPPRFDATQGPVWAGSPAVVSQGAAQNWGGFQRY